MPRRHPKYPHLLPPDIQVWDAYLAEHPLDQHQIAYDVRVGTPPPVNTDLPAKYKAMAWDLTMKRIDAVLFLKHEIVIVEITHTCGFTALGQILSYPKLYQDTYFPNLPVNPLLVTRRLLPDMGILLDYHHVPYHVVAVGP